MTDRLELHVSEEDAHREPLAAKLAEMFIADGTITRVDARGRAVDAEGNYTEGEWDARREEYFPNQTPTDPPAPTEPAPTEPAPTEPSPVVKDSGKTVTSKATAK